MSRDGVTNGGWVEDAGESPAEGSLLPERAVASSAPGSPSRAGAASAPKPSSLKSARSAGALLLGWPLRHPVLALCLAFAVSRAALYAAGLRFRLDIAWMFLADPRDLRDQLWETVWYFHAFPPGMNLLTGGLLQFGDAALRLGAPLVFVAAGAALVVALFRMLELLRLPRGAALLVALLFSLTPASLYFENLYLYTYPCAALLTAGLVAFVGAVRHGGWLRWLWVFLAFAALGWLRTTFHLVWFALMLALALLLSHRGTRRHVLLGASLPAALLISLYAKNFLLFGVFGTTSWSGANLTLATTQRMPAQLRQQWVREGILSPLANINVFAPPRSYRHLVSNRGPFPWPGSNELWRPTLRHGNYNHGFFLEVNRQRRLDALAFIRRRPEAYWRTVLETNLPSFFAASTHWHPADHQPTNPHAGHRRALGAYEALYDRLVHRWPSRPAGLYWALVPTVAWALLRSARFSFRLWRSTASVRSSIDPLLLLLVVQIGFVTTVSVLMTAQESARYRYVVEPCIWALTAVAVRHLWRGPLASLLEAARRILPSRRST